MTKKTRQAIENALDELEQTTTGDVNISSSVVVVDEDGNTPTPEPPEGYRFGHDLTPATEVVTVHELHPVDD